MPTAARWCSSATCATAAPTAPASSRSCRRLVESGRALATLGNHEINLLRGDRKDGNDWFWSEFNARDAKYEPRAHLPPEQRDGVIAFLRSLPLALERADLRVVHAAWDLASIAHAARRRSRAEPRRALPALGRRRRGA